MTDNLNNIPAGQLVTVVGNRPQFIKMTAVNNELERRGLRHVILHTGQHYDHAMNGVFFEELSIRPPDLQLSLSGTTHGAMTGELLEKIESIFLQIQPKGVLVYGDTNSTLAAALAAVKLQIPVAHVEAGPRLGNLETPEEVNRIVADHVATLRFACDAPSVKNLGREGIVKGVINAGDVMYDVFRQNKERLSLKRQPSSRPRIYMTLHRPQNVDELESHIKIIDFITQADAEVVFPVHARTRSRIERFGLMQKYLDLPNLRMSGPIGYLDSLAAVLESDFVITDSGGLQKEAYFARKLAMLMLPQTPWPELQKSGWLSLGGWVSDGRLLSGYSRLLASPLPSSAPPFFGSGNSAAIIVDALVSHGFVSP